MCTCIIHFMYVKKKQNIELPTKYARIEKKMINTFIFNK